MVQQIRWRAGVGPHAWPVITNSSPSPSAAPVTRRRYDRRRRAQGRRSDASESATRQSLAAAADTALATAEAESPPSSQCSRKLQQACLHVATTRVVWQPIAREARDGTESGT